MAPDCVGSKTLGPWTRPPTPRHGCAIMRLLQGLNSLLRGLDEGKHDQMEEVREQRNNEWRSDSSCSTSGASPLHSGTVQAKGDVCSPWCELTNSETQHMTQDTLEETMYEIASSVKHWRDGHYTFVKKLEDAVKNHGHVDLMWAPGPAGPVNAAVKCMPNKWVRTGPADFQHKYPLASERPWVDLGIVKELNKLGFPYACELFGVFRDEENTFVATSIATDGRLFAWCDCDPGPGLAREDVMRPIANQMFTAVRWLHELGIAHRDLSLENILLTDTGSKAKQVKIIDFGMATLSRACKHEVRGKQSYQAPEMHLHPEYDAFLTDGFALGVVLFAMATQDYPWTSTKPGICQLFEYVRVFGFRHFLEKRKLRKGNGDYLVEVLSPAFVDLLDSLLEPDPRHRNNLGEACYAPAKDNGSVFSMTWLTSPINEPLSCGDCTFAGG